jgi:uncharacterized protein YdiU (UPF0061 family)
MNFASIIFDNSYARELVGFYAPCLPERAPSPSLLYLNLGLAEELGLGLDPRKAEQLGMLFSGNALPSGAQPIAQAYSGHQFGHFSPQLGDGRALLVGEVIDRQGRRRDIAFKGSGRTPFSRNGDGKAAVGPMLREALIGEAMQALGISTTRALAVVATGELVRRDRLLPGAILTRVAASHLRVGTFQYFSAHAGLEQVRQLADYAIARHFPELEESDRRYLGFLQAVAERQAALVARWMQVGFIHGVMNTDNMSISGETIDFGPCAFMETYNPETVFSSIDAEGRYAYQAQPAIARWNLARLAETLLPLLDVNEGRAIEMASEVIDEFPAHYHGHWLTGFRAKLGLLPSRSGLEREDVGLIEAWLDLLHAQRVDFTLAWRRLGNVADGDEAPLRSLFPGQPGLDRWLFRWRERCALDDVESDHASYRGQAMRQVNPCVIPRNQIVEEALAAASDEGDLGAFERLLAALREPFRETLESARYALPSPEEFSAGYRTFCGT